MGASFIRDRGTDDPEIRKHMLSLYEDDCRPGSSVYLHPMPSTLEKAGDRSFISLAC